MECVVKPNIIKITKKYLLLDPKLRDLIQIRFIKDRTGECSKILRRIWIGIVKDNTDEDSWLSTKTIQVVN